jgi:SSS family solute:Na+ symporter
MTEPLIWLLAFVAAYVIYTVFWGVASARVERTAEDFFLAGRQLPAWVYVLCATALSLSAWSFAGYPALLAADGLPAGELALGTVATALTGVLFLKRQWLLSRLAGHITQGQMFSAYYGGEAIRVLGVLIALLFAVPFAGQQMVFGAQMIEKVSGGAVDPNVALWVLGFALFLYACFGGLRAVTAVGALQGLLVVTGMIAIGCLAYLHLDGFASLQQALARMAANESTGSMTAQGYHPWFTVPGVVQFTAGLGHEMPVGGPWTAAMILSTGFALMGLQATPAFTQLALACRDARGFAPQQVWAGAGVTGLVLLFFALAAAAGVPAIGSDAAGDVVTYWIGSLNHSAPWFAGLLTVCALAAVQIAAAAYATTTATVLTVDVFQRFMVPNASDRAMRLAARLSVCLLLLCALLVASFAPRMMVHAGALALPSAAQLLPALAGLCWWRWITRQGATLGLFAGLIAVLLTEPLGGAITSALGFELPWGRWPWTIHSAGWGLFCNLLICVPVSLATRRRGDLSEREHRARHHRFLFEHGGASAPRRVQRPAVWALTLVWFFFGMGPGVVIGNDVFGAPGAGLAGWLLGVPSLWAWQVLWWSLGVIALWWLAYKMELATVPRRAVEPAQNVLPSDKESGEPRAPLWVRNFLRRVT